MGTWDDAVEGHAANGRLAETEARLQQARDRLEEGPALEEWDRINRLVTETRSRLSLVDRSLVSTRMLDALDDAFIELNRALDLELAEEGPVDLGDVAKPRQALADVLAGWPTTLPEESAEAAQEAVNGLRDATQAAMASLEQRLREGTEQANGLRASVETAHTQNAEALEGLRGEITDLTNTIAQEKLRLDQAIQSNQVLFEQTQGQRSTEFAASQATWVSELDRAKEELATTLTDLTAKSLEQAEEADERTKQLVEAIQGMSERAKDLVGVIGRTGMTGGYQQDAVAEEESANRWRTTAVRFASAAVVVLGVAVIIASYVSTDPTRLISKALVAAALGGIATYAARQSAHHRANARNARNLELALASIGPYLEPLDPDKQKEVLEVFAYVLFAQRPVSTEAGDAVELGPTNLQTLIEVIQRARGG